VQDHPELHDLMNRLVMELPDPGAPPSDAPAVSLRSGTPGTPHGASRSPRARASQPRSPAASFGGSTPRKPTNRATSPAQPRTPSSRRSATAISASYSTPPPSSATLASAASPRMSRRSHTPEMTSPRRSTRRSGGGQLLPLATEAMPLTRRTASGHVSSADLGVDIRERSLHSAESSQTYEVAAGGAMGMPSLRSQRSMPAYDISAPAVQSRVCLSALVLYCPCGLGAVLSEPPSALSVPHHCQCSRRCDVFSSRNSDAFQTCSHHMMNIC
jgi:hypothetical protein